MIFASKSACILGNLRRSVCMEQYLRLQYLCAVANKNISAKVIFNARLHNIWYMYLRGLCLSRQRISCLRSFTREKKTNVLQFQLALRCIHLCIDLIEHNSLLALRILVYTCVTVTHVLVLRIYINFLSAITIAGLLTGYQ